ncbi:hypothetical protein Tco_0969578 [Tanacetum coccineum]
MSLALASFWQRVLEGRMCSEFEPVLVFASIVYRLEMLVFSLPEDCPNCEVASIAHQFKGQVHSVPGLPKGCQRVGGSLSLFPLEFWPRNLSSPSSKMRIQDGDGRFLGSNLGRFINGRSMVLSSLNASWFISLRARNESALQIKEFTVPKSEFGEAVGNIGSKYGVGIATSRSRLKFLGPLENTHHKAISMSSDFVYSSYGCKSAVYLEVWSDEVMASLPTR